MKTWTGMTIAVAVAAASVGCAQKAPVAAVVIEDKLYTVAPDQLKVKAGILTGEVTEMKVIERVEQGTGRVDTPAKLTGKLKLTNSSKDQTVRMLGGTILYIDEQGELIKLDDSRTPSAIRFSTSYNSPDRLDPGQDTTQSLDVEFPAAALQAKKLKEIRLQLSYIPSAYRVETAHFDVSISSQ